MHRSIIEWNARHSDTKIPDRAVGLDPVGLALMRWAMASWPRTRFISRYLGGTLLPRLQLDLLPGLGCAAHVVIVAPTPPRRLEDFVAAGAAVQRLWLTATRLGLQHQPEMTPLIFAGYHRTGLAFSSEADAQGRAARVGATLDAMLGPAHAANAVWMGRVGEAPAARARSLRSPLDALASHRPAGHAGQAADGSAAPALAGERTRP